MRRPWRWLRRRLRWVGSGHTLYICLAAEPLETALRVAKFQLRLYADVITADGDGEQATSITLAVDQMRGVPTGMGLVRDFRHDYARAHQLKVVRRSPVDFRLTLLDVTGDEPFLVPTLEVLTDPEVASQAMLVLDDGAYGPVRFHQARVLSFTPPEVTDLGLARVARVDLKLAGLAYGGQLPRRTVEWL